MKTGLSRPPMPWLVACALAVNLAAMGELSMSVALIWSLHCYLRPYELFGNRFMDVLKLVANMAAWCVVVCPETGGRPSKAGVFDDTLRFDSVLRSGIAEKLHVTCLLGCEQF